MGDKEIIRIYGEGLVAVITLVRGMDEKLGALSQELSSLKQNNERLNTRITVLEAQLNKNSNNSSKPPSSDGLKRILKISVKNPEDYREASLGMKVRHSRRLRTRMRLLI